MRKYDFGVYRLKLLWYNFVVCITDGPLLERNMNV